MYNTMIGPSQQRSQLGRELILIDYVSDGLLSDQSQTALRTTSAHYNNANLANRCWCHCYIVGVKRKMTIRDCQPYVHTFTYINRSVPISKFQNNKFKVKNQTKYQFPKF